MLTSSSLIPLPAGGFEPPPQRIGRIKNAAGFVPLARSFKWLRRRRGLTLGDIANALGVSKPSVWAWENGKCRPHPQRIESLATLLGVGADDLAGLWEPVIDIDTILENCRNEIAAACGVGSDAVHITVEL